MNQILSVLERDILINGPDVKDVVSRFKKKEKEELFQNYYSRLLKALPSFNGILERIEKDPEKVYIFDDLNSTINEIEDEIMGPDGSSFFLEVENIPFTKKLIYSLDLAKKNIDEFQIKQDSFYIISSRNILGLIDDKNYADKFLENPEKVNLLRHDYFTDEISYCNFLFEQIEKERYICKVIENLFGSTNRLGYKSNKFKEYEATIPSEMEFNLYQSSFALHQRNKF